MKEPIEAASPPAGTPLEEGPAHRRGLAYLPLGLGVLVLFGLWWGLGAAERARTEEHFLEEIRHAARHVGDYVTVRIANAEAIASLRQAGMLGDEARFRRHAAIVQERLGGYFAVNWIDEAGVIRWVSPLEPNRRAIGHSVFEHPQAAPMARLAARSRRLTLTGPLRLFQGRDGFAAYLPVARDGRLVGFVNAVFDLRHVLSATFGERWAEHFALRIEGHDGNRFETDGFERAWRRGPQLEARAQILGFTWEVRAAPTEAALAARPVGVTRHVVLAVGLVGLLFATLFVERQREQRLLRGKLRKARQDLARVVEDSPEFVAMADPDGRLLHLNAAGRERVGDHVIGESVLALVPDEEQPLVEATLRRAAREGSVVRVMAPFGPAGDVHEIAFAPIRDEQDRTYKFLVHARNEQQRLDLERQLARSQRLEAVGRLAGGVAHDFNNVLGAVTTLASLVRAEHPEVAEDMEALVEAAERGGELTRKLLALARQHVGDSLRHGDATETLRGLRKLLRSVVPAHTELHVELPDEAAWVGLSAAELEQIVSNLVLNAADAVEPGGCIEVRLEATAEHVVLTVRDDGRGMPPEVLEHAFEPFFSTKEGRGSGLGLASVYGLVRNQGGQVHLQSAPNEGTTVVVELPRLAAPDRAPSPRPRARSLAGRRILLVEDEGTLRRALARWLQARGATVRSARDGREALRLLTREPFRPDVVVTDVVMPHMNGPDLVEALRAMGYTAPVVFVSGYVEQTLSEERLRALDARLVAKPFHPQRLVELVAELAARAPADERAPTGQAPPHSEPPGPGHGSGPLT